MRIYEDYRTIDEWAVTYTLELDEEGKFSYDEYWGCYAGSNRIGADGRWWQSGKTIFFHTERADEYIRLELVPGQDRIAVGKNDVLRFSDELTFRLRRESAGNLHPPNEPIVLDKEINTAAQLVNIKPFTTQNEPQKISPQLLVRIRQWIDELALGKFQNRISNLGKRFNILPLHTNSIFMWALNLDGNVVCLDHESSSDRPEPETNPVKIYAVMIHGACKHRELAELIPACPEGIQQCKLCGGIGWKKSADKTMESCFMCQGFGWYMPVPPR